MSPGVVVRRTLRRMELLAGGVDWKRFVLDPDLLRESLTLRAAAARVRASLPDAVERERRFLEVSESYRSRRDDNDPSDVRTRGTTVDGVPWSVPVIDPDNEAAVAHSLHHQNFPYRAITQTREVALGGIMLDIGANNGRMSIPRVLLGDVHAAYCAEPEPANYASLVRNVRENGVQGLVMPDRVAIGSEDTVVKMMKGKTPGGHRVINDGAKAKRGTIDVPCMTIDSWCERLGIDLRLVTFVKVDTQGSEVHVLRGASRLLACPQVAWQIEIDVGLLRARGFAAGDVFAVLQRHFTHWIDLNRQAKGARVRGIHALPGALSYILEGNGSRTDVLVFTLRTPSTEPAEPR